MEYEYNGILIKIVNDDDPQSPREWDNLGKILYTSHRYILGDECVDASQIREVTEREDVIWLPVYAYIHGGVTINTTGFSCPWDSGQCGIIYVEKDDVKKEYQWNRLTSKRVRHVEDVLRREIKDYDTYLTGNVLGFELYVADECIDSCYGYYGLDHCKEEAESSAKHHSKMTV